MYALARPFVRLWDYVGNVGGFPGQMFFILAVIMLGIVVCTWVSNRK